MGLKLSEYLLRDFEVEHVDSVLLEIGDDAQVKLPAASRSYFHLVLAGSARVELEASGQRVSLQAGDFALLLYGAAHTLGRADARRRKSVHVLERLKSGDEPSVLTLGGEPREPRVLSGSVQLTRKLRNAPVNRALSHLLCYPVANAANPAGLAQIEKSCRGPGAAAFVQALVNLHLIQVLRRVHEDMQQAFPVHLGSPDMGRMASVVRKIRAHPEKRWTVALLAEEAGWSRSAFAAKFQAYAGLGPIRFVARTRLNRAAAMLSGNPDLPLWEIARRVGYDTQGSFTRAFKAEFGVPPRHYVEHLTRAPVLREMD